MKVTKREERKKEEPTAHTHFDGNKRGKVGGGGPRHNMKEDEVGDVRKVIQYKSSSSINLYVSHQNQRKVINDLV